MSNTLERQLAELAERTNAETRSLAPEQAREVRAASLEQARELVERSSPDGPELRRVSRAPMPRPGETGMRRAGVRP